MTTDIVVKVQLLSTLKYFIYSNPCLWQKNYNIDSWADPVIFLIDRHPSLTLQSFFFPKHI